MSALYSGVRFAAGVHAGVSPGVELGGGVGALISPGVVPIFVSDASVDAKFRIGEVPDSRLHLALNPRLRVADWNEAWFPMIVELPLLVGYDVGSSQVVLVPRVGLFVDFVEGTRATPQVGVTLGWVLPVSEDLELLPGVGVDWTASRDETAAGAKAGEVTVAGGISFIVVIE